MKIKPFLIKSTMALGLMLGSAALMSPGTASAQATLGSWQNNTGDGWSDYGNQLAITNVANTNEYQFVAGAVAGYAQSLEINIGGFNHDLKFDLNSKAGAKAAFVANHQLTFTVSFPPAAASGATAGFSQIYSFTLDCSGFYTNIPWSSWTGNAGNMPGVGYYSGYGGQSITVTWDYSDIFTNPVIYAAMTNSSYLNLSFTSNNGGGAPTNLFINNVVLAGAVAPPSTSTYVVDDFSTNGVSSANPTNDDYYNSVQNYSAGQITNVWGKWFGNAVQSVTFDPTTDANNNPASGSLELGLNWSNDTQFVVWDQGTANDYYALNISGLMYTNFQCDVKFAPGSASSVGNGSGPGGITTGIFGHLRFGDRTFSYGQDWFGSVDVLATNSGWVHVSIPLNAVTDTNLLAIQGLIIGIDSGYYGLNLTTNGNGLNGSSTLWVDNVKFVGAGTSVTSAPPTLSLQQANPGLRIFAGSSANTYDREELATTDNNQSWVGGSYPVSYSFTLQDYNPSIAQIQLFVVPAASSGQANMGNAGSVNQYIDYQASNELWLVINPYTNPAGSVTASVQYKIGTPNSNPNITAGSLTNSTAVGTWTLSFTSAAGGTLTAPGGNSTAFSISDPGVATDFANPAVAYFGIQPNTGAGEGQYIDYASISVAGVTGANESENFANESTFNATSQWANNSAQTSSIQLVTTNTPYWINWSLPAVGYNLGTAETITGNTNTLGYGYVLPEYYNGYADGPSIPGSAIQGTRNWLLIPATCLPTTDGTTTGPKSPNAFFRLFNPPLQN